MTASIVEQDPNTQTVKNNINLIWQAPFGKSLFQSHKTTVEWW